MTVAFVIAGQRLRRVGDSVNVIDVWYEKGNLIQKICGARERDLLCSEEFWGEVKQERTRSAVAARRLRALL